MAFNIMQVGMVSSQDGISFGASTNFILKCHSTFQ